MRFLAISTIYVAFTIAVGALICETSRMANRHRRGPFATALLAWGIVSGGIAGLVLASLIIHAVGLQFELTETIYALLVGH